MGRELREGEYFAGFRVQRRLGAGGMGAVYAVEHPRLPRIIALKLLTADASDAGAAARFDREAETIARLDHPGIVGVLDRGVEHGQPWISMQLIDGTDAGAFLRANGPLSPEQVMRIARGVAQALDAAHRRGVVHRDIKPANIMLTRADSGPVDFDRALITDFGIARLQAIVPAPSSAGTSAADQGAPPGSTPVEITGLIDGVRATAAFASPEQLRGGPVDGRSDQYSLACTLFALLTGRPPFPGTVGQSAQGHLSAPVPAVEQTGVNVPPRMSAALRRAMSKDPTTRFASCHEMTDAFGDEHASAPNRSTRALVAVLAAVTIALAGFGTWWVTRDRSTVTAAETTSSLGTVEAEAALWKRAAPALALWPNLFPQLATSKGYQNMICIPSSEQGAAQVHHEYKFQCTAREQGLNKPIITVDLLAYSDGGADRVYDSMGTPPALPMPAHPGLQIHSLNDPVAGPWILVRYTDADRKDYLLQVGSQDGKQSFSQLFDWIAAAPF